MDDEELRLTIQLGKAEIELDHLTNDQLRQVRRLCHDLIRTVKGEESERILRFEMPLTDAPFQVGDQIEVSDTSWPGSRLFEITDVRGERGLRAPRYWYYARATTTFGLFAFGWPLRPGSSRKIVKVEGNPDDAQS